MKMLRSSVNKISTCKLLQGYEIGLGGMGRITLNIWTSHFLPLEKYLWLRALLLPLSRKGGGLFRKGDNSYIV